MAPKKKTQPPKKKPAKAAAKKPKASEPVYCSVTHVWGEGRFIFLHVIQGDGKLGVLQLDPEDSEVVENLREATQDLLAMWLAKDAEDD